MVAVIIVVALISGFVAAAIAGSRGLRPGGFFFAGALLPIIGIVLAATVKPAPKAAE